ncbi:MAG: hypothetical protein H6766_01805 [Candidatus Peribacteria bacterium]|nr:MAG: hypothetical protein H6766_01805 [Candidatus Peribacteria bacterium]
MAITRTQTRRSPWKLWIIPVILVVLVALLLWTKKDALLEKLGLQTIDSTDA